ncbi:MAG: tyrosine-type recombinase/integrase [Vicinamibacterales bacterium]
MPRAPRRAPQFVSADVIKRVERALRTAAAEAPAQTTGGGLTQEAWYALVWQAPLTTLARQRGTSNTAIAKMCRRLQVPTPPAGYWAQHRVGRASAPPPLPPRPAPSRHRTDSLALRRLIHAFFMVVASTGLRPSQVNRVMQTVRGEDVARRVVLVKGGKGGEPIPLVLNSDQQAAFQALLAARIPVPDSTPPQFVRMDATRYARAVRAAGWPSDVRPYNARHAVGIELAERGAEDADIQAQFGHTDLAMVRRHYTGVRLSKMRRISEALEGRLGWGEITPTTTPPPTAVRGGNWRKLAGKRRAASGPEMANGATSLARNHPIFRAF